MTLDAWQYGDPAAVAERMELDRLGCSLCASSAMTLLRGFCAESKNTKQKGFPTIGHHCRWFVERDAKGQA